MLGFKGINVNRENIFKIFKNVLIISKKLKTDYLIVNTKDFDTISRKKKYSINCMIVGTKNCISKCHEERDSY